MPFATLLQAVPAHPSQGKPCERVDADELLMAMEEKPKICREGNRDREQEMP
jgi:hypothetical protein